MYIKKKPKLQKLKKKTKHEEKEKKKRRREKEIQVLPVIELRTFKTPGRNVTTRPCPRTFASATCIKLIEPY